MRPEKLYHGTKSENVKSILEKGLQRLALLGSDKTYIYTMLTRNEANQWGDVVFEIEVVKSDNLRYFEDENPIWQILIMNDIPPERLRVV